MFLPTWSGALASIGLMAATIVFHQFGAIRQFVGIPNGIDLQHFAGSTADAVVNRIFGQSHTDTAVVALFWAVIGVFVYLIVVGIVGAMRELGSDVEEQNYLWPQNANPKSLLKGFVERMAVHVAALIILIFYILSPLAIVLHGPLLQGSSLAHHVALSYVVWFVVGIIAWHGLTVVLRLLFLRDRLIG